MRRSLLVPLIALSFAAGALSIPTSAWSADKAPTKSKSGAAKAAAPAAPTPSKENLAKVQNGMTPEKVKEIMGSPTSENAYPTGKAFIPFYYGPDTGRTDWKYKGVGRVVFSRNRYSGDLKVIRVDFDPGEKG
jgi:outer membrane protein assembly factor BamE (lipoprotein component of BamABCDE complex)